MGKAAKAETEANEQAQDQAAFKSPPQVGDDYQDISGGRADGWYQAEKGSWIQGKLLGRFEYTRNGKARAFYQMKIRDASANMISGKGDEAETLEVKAGHVVAFDERATLRVLQPYAESDGVFEILIVCNGKKEARPGENTPYLFDTKFRQLKKPSRPVKPYRAKASKPEADYGDDDFGGDDIPF